MINGMGATPLSELYIVTKNVLEALEEKGIKITKLFVGDYMTALDMQGFSLTVLNHSEQIVSALNAPTESAHF